MAEISIRCGISKLPPLDPTIPPNLTVQAAPPWSETAQPTFVAPAVSTNPPTWTDGVIRDSLGDVVGSTHVTIDYSKCLAEVDATVTFPASIGCPILVPTSSVTFDNTASVPTFVSTATTAVNKAGLCETDLTQTLTLPCNPLPTVKFAAGVSSGLSTPSTSVTVTRGTGCDWEVDLGLLIPDPCVTFTSGAINVSLGTGTNDFKFTRTTGPCSIALGTDLFIPCPTVTTVIGTPTPGGKFTSSIDPATCAETLTIQFPTTGTGGTGCPTIATSATAGWGASPAATLTATPTGTCSIALDLSVTEACPTITSSGSAKWGVSPAVTTTTTFTAPCKYNIDVAVTEGCPTLTANTVMLGYGAPGSSPDLELIVTSVGSCGWNVEGTILQGCPSFSVSSSVATGTTGGSVSITSGSNCSNALNIIFPSQGYYCPTITAAAPSAGTYATTLGGENVYLTVTKTAPCTFSLAADIVWPPKKQYCPTFTSDGSSGLTFCHVTDGTADPSSLSIGFADRYPSDPTKCEFYYHVNANISAADLLACLGVSKQAIEEPVSITCVGGAPVLTTRTRYFLGWPP